MGFFWGREAVLTTPYFDKAKSAVQHSIERHRLRLPTDRTILRVTFDIEPSWELLSLVQAFDHDSFLVFGQALKITDAYYGCFEADFEPSDQRDESLKRIVRQVLYASDFDDLITKYRILAVKLFNFPNEMPEVVVDYVSGREQHPSLHLND
jgi:hypothetical protein